ncbi:endo-beta-N-acetylglucosaminidase [Vagococcus fluvialis]|uniref:endo-beta-N-acetylglucosaminidase n=1 Tax=Vagococcus fluvialis TaxID=2738 RepID=UPI003B5AEEB7
MKQLHLKSTSALVLLTAASFGLAACSQDDAKTSSNIKFSETEKATMDKGMDNQPESSYWFPEDLLAWDYNQDLDAKYNVSRIPLADRVDKKELPKSNDTQNEEMKVVALSIMNGSTSGNAPRGLNNFDANVFSNWQYIDQLVYWGGSSGEGIIVPPSPDVIDAAHKNGVPVLGTIFFPQTAHGGKIEWLDTFLEKDDNGEFPIVDKMIEVADVYGFDGWFINQETDTEVTSFDDAKEGKKEEAPKEGGLTKKHADLMQELIAEFKEKADDKQDIMWYDSMTSEGKMDWQNALTDENKAYMVDADMKPLSDSMFLNFWWSTDELAKEDLLTKSNQKAKEIDINPYDLFAGIDVQENGYATPVKWDLFTDDAGKPLTSLGLYVPSWTYASSSNPDEFQEKENVFWVNGEQDATKGKLPEEGEWPGISTFAVEQTAITSLPFTTNFNLGNGYNYFIDGEKVSSMEWNNRSMQDIMPTHRWNFKHGKGNNLAVTMDYTDAYQGGNSLKLRGTMNKNEPSTMKLYETKLKFDKETTFTTTAKASEKTDIKLVVTYDDGKTESFKADKAIGEDWTTVTFDVKKAANKTVTAIDYELTAQETSDTYEFKFGQLAVKPKMKNDSLSVSGLEIEDAIFDEEESNYAGVRLIWDDIESDSLASYEIYRVNEDDTRSFLGTTVSNNFYVNALERQEKVTKTKFEVIPVNTNGERGKASKAVTMEWPDNTVPKASFTASRTLIAPGEKVTFNNTSSTNTDSVKWEFTGGDVETSEENEVAVTFDKPGTYTVKMTAKNDSGETPIEMENLITVDDKAKGDLALLSKGAKAEASSFVNDGEAPEFALDGKLDTKWCATGNPPHNITIDLGEVKTISEVHIGHAEAGGEAPDMNTRAYTIEVSEDGKEFTQVTRIINNEKAETVDTFAATKAQFVRFTTDKPTQGADSATRIYELGVYGLK